MEPTTTEDPVVTRIIASNTVEDLLGSKVMVFYRVTESTNLRTGDQVETLNIDELRDAAGQDVIIHAIPQDELAKLLRRIRHRTIL